MRAHITAAFAAIAMATGAAAAQQPMPPGMTHEEHLKQMQKDADLKKHGDAAMGFDQDAAVHHFRLTPEGGAIEVLVKRTTDEKNRAAIRQHLKEIATSFSAGDFSKPFMTHGENPPGATQMAQLAGAITYTYADVPAGGRVRIHAATADAVAAIHSFLRYQITEHHTGDALKVGK